jgi:hypothetical protein
VLWSNRSLLEFENEDVADREGNHAPLDSSTSACAKRTALSEEIAAGLRSRARRIASSSETRRMPAPS